MTTDAFPIPSIHLSLFARSTHPVHIQPLRQCRDDHGVSSEYFQERTVFIGRLSVSVNAANLTTMFSQAGVVKSVRITHGHTNGGKSKGRKWATVRFETPQAASAAVELFHDKHVEEGEPEEGAPPLEVRLDRAHPRPTTTFNGGRIGGKKKG